MKLGKYSQLLFSTLSEITSLAIGRKDKPLIIQRLLDGCIAALEAEKVYMLELDGEKVIKYSKDRSAGLSEPMVVEEIAETPVLRQWVVREGHERATVGKGAELAIDLSLLAQRCLSSGDGNRLIISSPVVTERSVFGLLVAIHPSEGERYSREDEQLITALANQAAIAFENRLLYEKLEKEAITDGLTGVYNYRYLIASLGTEVKRAQRFRQSFSFAMLDVDNLKTFNDRLGHLSGSEALRNIARMMKEATRDIDFVAKYGGDEFAMILPRTDLDGAVVVTDRVIQAVRKYEFVANEAGLLTCSAGISSFPHDGQTAREIIASADRALYHAKRAGKNTVATTNDLLDEIRT